MIDDSILEVVLLGIIILLVVKCFMGASMQYKMGNFQKHFLKAFKAISRSLESFSQKPGKLFSEAWEFSPRGLGSCS